MKKALTSSIILLIMVCANYAYSGQRSDSFKATTANGYLTSDGARASSFDQFVSTSGDKMSGHLDMGGNNIVNVSTLQFSGSHIENLGKLTFQDFSYMTSTAPFASSAAVAALALQVTGSTQSFSGLTIDTITFNLDGTIINSTAPFNHSRRFTFQLSDLTNGEITLNHGLNTSITECVIRDENGYKILPDETIDIDDNNIKIILRSFTGIMSGYWKALVKK